MPVLPILLALTAPATAQDVKLDANTREAALTCAAALGKVDPVSIDRVTRRTWLSVTAAKEVVPVEQVMAKATADLGEMDTRADTLGGEAARILDLCRQRFPQAWQETGVQLPADSFDRRSLCFVAQILLATYEAEGDRTAVNPVIERWAPLLPDAELKARGITGEAGYAREMGRVLILSLPLGNLRGVVNACDAAYPELA